MGKIKNLKYIRDIGIKKVLCHTNMGNTIYILNNGQKYKQFSEDYRNLNDTVNREFQEMLIRQTEEYGNNLISYPEIVISTEKKLFGIVGDYEQGIPLSKIDSSTQIDYLLYLLDILEQETEVLSFRGWSFEDLHEENILINNLSKEIPIRIIDTDYFVYQEEKEKYEIYKANLKRIFSSITSTILEPIGKPNLLKDKDIEEQYWLAVNGLIKASDFLRFLLEKIKITNQKENTIKTLQKSIKLM